MTARVVVELATGEKIDATSVLESQGGVLRVYTSKFGSLMYSPSAWVCVEFVPPEPAGGDDDGR